MTKNQIYHFFLNRMYMWLFRLTHLILNHDLEVNCPFQFHNVTALVIHNNKGQGTYVSVVST